MAIYDRLNEISKEKNNKSIQQQKNILQDLIVRKTIQDEESPRINVEYDNESKEIIEQILSDSLEKYDRKIKSNIYKCFWFYKDCFSNITNKEADKLYEKIINIYYTSLDSTKEENAYNC